MSGIPGAVFIANVVLLAGLIIQTAVAVRTAARHERELDRYRAALRDARKDRR